MDCEQALALISAQIDRQIEPADRERLEQHLADCPACRATADAFALQDEELRHTFAPRREAAAATAERVASRLGAPPRSAGARFVPRRPGPRLALVLGAVAAAACVVAAVRWWPRPQQPDNPEQVADGGAGPTQVLFDLLTPRERPAAPEARKLTVGETVVTRAGERQRRRLPDGSVLYVDQNTSLRLDADRRATLDRGAVFLEVAPQAPEAGGTTFVVRTPDREVKAHGTRFEVRAGGPGTGVVVTQGRVGVTPPDSPSEVPVQSGQQLLPPADKPSAAPRASYVLDWTRDLMAAAESPLVPASRFDGGALIAVDPTGQEAKLALRKYHVDVHVEDGFARTTIDQTYFNFHPWRLEGTFYFPLPPDASLSRLAMYVDGKLMEGGMAERDYARAVYERIVSSQRDPALLEWVDGTTFKMRVFPLEGRQEKRIVLSYTQRLPGLYGRTQYRFPAGHSLHGVDRWSFHALVKGGAGLTAASPSHPALKAEKRGGDLVLSAEEKDARVDRDVVVDLTDPSAGAAKESVRYNGAELDGARYLMLRFRPELPGEGKRQRRDWVILFESSADRDPLLARAQIEVVRGLLTNAEHDDRFAVLTAGTVVRRFGDGLQPATPENVAAAIQFLERTHLVGTLDLGKALDEAAAVLKGAKSPYLVHVGAGLTGMGRRQDELVKSIPAGAHYVGVGVGKRWARSFMKDAAERTGGYFTQINPDEPVAWRAFDLLATLNTPRLLGVKVVANHAPGAPADAAAVFLTDNSYVCQGEELCACARVEGPLPQTVTVTGSVDGQPFSRVLPVADVVPGAGYLPRTWAKLEIERLLAEDARRNKDAVVALSKAMYVMTPFTSLLVLENEDMYREFKVDRGRRDHWAMYPCPERIPVVYEPDPTQPIDVRNAPKGLKPAPAQVMQTVLRRGGPRFVATEGREREAMLGRLRGIVSKQERLRARTDSFGLQLEDADDDLKREMGRPLSGTHWRHLGVEVTAPFTGARLHEHFGEVRLAGRPLAGTVLRREDLRDGLAFSPDGRRLLAGDEELGARVWNERTDNAFFFARGEVNGSMGHSLSLWEVAADKKKLGQLGYIPAAGLPASEAPPNSPAPVPAGLTPLVERGPALPSLLYQPLAFNEDPRLFTNLLAYAPGLDTSDADLAAVVEAEAAPQLRAAPGHIDAAARRLIERARQGGWQALALAAGKGRAGPTLVFDGQGRYACERTLPMGLREQVVCDGTTLLHLYPELGVGARRAVSRFHRAELLEVVPWLVPPAEDLARGADLVAYDHTVAVVPHRAGKNDSDKPRKSLRLLLIFAEDGRLAERRLVETPADKALRREVFDGKGGVRLLDGEGKELASRSYEVRAAAAPSLRPATSGLVVLPLPYRSREHVFPALGLRPQAPLAAEENGCFQYATPADALKLLATALASHNAGEAQLVFRYCFHERGDRRVGFFVVLAACGVDLTQEPAFLEHRARSPGETLVRYFTLGQDGLYEYLQATLPLNAGRSAAPADSFLGRLARLRDLYWRWRSNPSPWTATLARERDRRDALEFVRANPDLPAAWGLLSYVQARGRHSTRDYLALADTWAELAKGARAPYTARYERARCLLRAGRWAEAREQFQQLYAEALKEGVLPPIDRDFREALLQGDGRSPDLWGPLMRETAAMLIGGKRRPAAVALAWQCRQLEDAPLADHLLARALDGAPEGERVVTTLAVVEHLWQADQLPRAEQLVQGLLAEKELAQKPALWRLASVLADRRGATDRAVAALERALDLEYRDLPDVIDLQPWRRDYGRLLGHYRELASALSPLHTAAPADLAARAVRAADRWRAHDPEPAAPCQMAARVLKTLGARDLAWEYQTTATGKHPDESGTWVGLARALSREGDLDLAERAYAVAAAADPDNAQLLWDRAQNLRQAGRAEQAEGMFRTLAGRDWPNAPGIRTRAQWQLGSATAK
jgi:ferric-dicitrate binding protein FerR (iron transport regulator)/tetratricopeptide (TPR) repeat protein